MSTTDPNIYIFGPLAFSGSMVIPTDTSSAQMFEGEFSGSFTGSLLGTATYAQTASYALTASYISFTATASHLEEQGVARFAAVNRPTYVSGGFFRSSSGDWYLS